MTRLPAAARDRIREHARRAYPHECCGVLVGRAGEEGDEGAGVRDVVRAVVVENSRTDERGRRYLIPPDAVHRIDGEAREEGLDIVGFYHSHPDHPPEPSEFDREHAWPWYSYVIASIAGGDVGRMRAWRLTDDRGEFVEDDLLVVEDDPSIIEEET